MKADRIVAVDCRKLHPDKEWFAGTDEEGRPRTGMDRKHLGRNVYMAEEILTSE